MAGWDTQTGESPNPASTTMSNSPNGSAYTTSTHARMEAFRIRIVFKKEQSNLNLNQNSRQWTT